MLTIAQSAYVLELLYFLQVFTVKLSILAFYVRLFQGKIMRRLLWATMAVTATFLIVFSVMCIFQCNPISHFWTGWTGETKGHCLDVDAVPWASAASSILLDLWMLALPLSQLKKLRLHWKKKIGAALMFSVGLL